MAIPLVGLKAQYQAIKPEIDAAVARIFENTSFILGSEVQAFEEAFAAYCGAAHAVGVSSGTAALDLALMACGIGAGDEVITTPMTFVATAAAISHVGARPVLADIDPRTYNLDPVQVEAAITPRTRAILPVHLYGQPVHMEPLLAIAEAHDLRVIEDACQAVGARYHGRRAGSLGHVGCFSFYPSKNLGAAGDGGMIVTDDPEIADTVRKLRDHGRTSHYGHSLIGYTYRLDALQAAVLAVKLGHLDAWNAARRERAALYGEMLATTDLVTPYEAEGCESVYHIYAVRTPNRDRVLQELRQRGIGASIHYPIPVHLQAAYVHLGLPEGSYPVAETAANQVLSLPMYPELSHGQMAEVVEALKAIIG
ncbi:MAG: DegT/DnrJ/EryC1/StrS family aminotransferase [Anaerolineae bacterium]|nr:DegT/DnrJ/EryC1/StrS family aminotransferase [Anaerolineae bacterium]